MFNLFGLFGSIGKFLRKAVGLIGDAVTDERVGAALYYIQQAAKIFTDAASGALDQHKAREYVIKALMARFGLSESVARLILEIAYRLYKAGETGTK